MPSADYEADPKKLKACCERQGGKSSAMICIEMLFQNDVDAEALMRHLTQAEIEEVGFRGGFVLAQAYDCFLSKEGTRFVCGLCDESKGTSWKNKKDAVPHLRKYHFG
jgi:hypothetical protein